MKHLDNPLKMQKDIIKYTFLIGLIPAIYFIITGKPGISLGLLFGFLISILLLRLKYLHIERSLDMSEEKANSFIRNRYFIQYFIFLVVLIVAFKNPSVNFLATAAGLFLMKLTVIVWVIIDSIKNGKNEVKKKYNIDNSNNKEN